MRSTPLVVNIKVDTQYYKDQFAIYMRYHRQEIKEILGGSAAIFANHAATYVPPSMGKEKIDDNLYKRQLTYLPFKVRKDYKAKEKNEDLLYLKKGYLYKIRHYIARRKYKDLYFKKATAKVKAMKRIKNRGLLRVSFAMDLVTIGQKYPSKIRALLSKSKNLKKFKRFNKINFSTDFQKITIINDHYQAYSNENFAKIAIREGDKYAKDYIARKVKTLLNKKKVA